MDNLELYEYIKTEYIEIREMEKELYKREIILSKYPNTNISSSLLHRVKLLENAIKDKKRQLIISCHKQKRITK